MQTGLVSRPQQARQGAHWKATCSCIVIGSVCLIPGKKERTSGMQQAPTEPRIGSRPKSYSSMTRKVWLCSRTPKQRASDGRLFGRQSHRRLQSRVWVRLAFGNRAFGCVCVCQSRVWANRVWSAFGRQVARLDVAFGVAFQSCVWMLCLVRPTMVQ